MRHENHTEPSTGLNSQLDIRLFEPEDIPSFVRIAHANFDSPAYSLYPQSVVEAYKRANSADSLGETFTKPGTETYVITDGAGIVNAYYVLRQVAEDDGLTVDMRRMQIAPEAQGQGLAGKILTSAEQRAKDLGARRISIHAGGASRAYFERKGWTGNTVLVNFKPYPAITFYCAKELTSDQDEDLRYQADSIVWAGTNQRKINLLRQIAPDTVPIFAAPAEEEKGLDIIEVAKSKIESAKNNTNGFTSRTAFISTDVLNHILTYDDSSQTYVFKGRHKPSSPEEATQNFAEMLRYSVESGRPTPYVLKCATVVEIGGTQIVSLVDTSIWLKQSILKDLSTPQGFAAYRNEALANYGRDVMDNSAGFGFLYFLNHGGIEGINGAPIEDIDDLSQVSQDITKIAHGSPDPNLLNKVLNSNQS